MIIIYYLFLTYSSYSRRVINVAYHFPSAMRPLGARRRGAGAIIKGFLYYFILVITFRLPPLDSLLFTVLDQSFLQQEASLIRKEIIDWSKT